MCDSGAETDYLQVAANFSGGAVHLIMDGEVLLTGEENVAWVEALSDAADHDATPRSLLIYNHTLNEPRSDIYDTLSALKKSKRLTHLSLQLCRMSDE